jgi:FkbM family methyltransferase
MREIREIRRALKPHAMTTQPIKTRAPFMASYGFAPDVIVDVGVARGTAWLYRAFPEAKLVLIDPQPDCESMVRERYAGMAFDFHATALGADPGTATLKIPMKKTGPGIAMASLLDRQDALAQKFPETQDHEVPVQRLDDLMGAYDGRIGLKVDTEGFEHQILLGAPDTLKRCDFVILELSLEARFEGVSPPSGPIKLLADAGLELRDILSMASDASDTAKPRHIDALFARWAA